MKQTFEIPEGCTRVTIEQHEDKVLTIFETRIEESFMDKVVSVSANCLDFEFKEDEPEVVFKDGDILCYKDSYIFIFKNKRSEKQANYYYLLSEDVLFDNDWCGFENIHFATEPEKQQLFDALAKVGKKWNAEKKCIEELKPERWRAKKGCKYWFVSSSLNCLSTIDLFSLLDNIRYGVGNYFQTEQQAQDFAERIKQLPR